MREQPSRQPQLDGDTPEASNGESLARGPVGTVSPTISPTEESKEVSAEDRVLRSAEYLNGLEVDDFPLVGFTPRGNRLLYLVSTGVLSKSSCLATIKRESIPVMKESDLPY